MCSEFSINDWWGWLHTPLINFYAVIQALEKVPGIHLINQIIKQKAKKTGGRSAPQGLSGWAKAQMMMIYAIEHDEMWCHKGFLQARHLSSTAAATSRIPDTLFSMPQMVKPFTSLYPGAFPRGCQMYVDINPDLKNTSFGTGLCLCLRCNPPHRG